MQIVDFFYQNHRRPLRPTSTLLSKEPFFGLAITLSLALLAGWHGIHI